MFMVQRKYVNTAHVRSAVKCKLSPSAGLAMAFGCVVLVALMQVQHVELADTQAPGSPVYFRSSSFSTGIRSRIDVFNVRTFVREIRTRIGDLAAKAFQTFTEAYNRTYTPEEIDRRLSIFLERFKEVQQWNRDYKARKVSFSMKLNHLADRTTDELNRLNGLRTPKDFDENMERRGRGGLLSLGRSLAAPVPESKDWRQSGCLPAVRDQESCGCCYAFATVDMVGTNYCLEKGLMASTLALRSPQQVVDCGSRDWQYGQHMNGCDGGWPEHNIKYLQKKKYLATEQQYPYDARQGECKLKTGLKVSKHRSGPKYVELYTEQEFKNHIGQHGPVVAAVHASNAFQMYNGDLFDDRTCLGRQWNHAVLVVGYGRAAGKDYWIIKNSYGTDWGENGYMRMVRGKSLCKIGRMGWGLIPSGSSSPSSPSSPSRPWALPSTPSSWSYFFI